LDNNIVNSTEPKINPGSVKSGCFEQSPWQYSKNLGTRNSELQIYYSIKEKNIGQHLLLPPFQIIRHSKNLGESKHLKFDQNYRENYKKL
jgi:hypothetical protein